MGDQALLDLMRRYREAFGAADEAGLTAVVTEDFVWHTHLQEPGDVNTTGIVLVGVKAMVAEIVRRQTHWKNVRFENLVERAAGEFILQMFKQSGVDEQDRPYEVNVVDVYSVRDGLISKKDTYWKGQWGDFQN